MSAPKDTVATRTLPMWRLRAQREAPRMLLGLLALAGIVASVRFTIFPPGTVVRRAAPAPLPADRSAEAYAVLFARRYLTWNAAEPGESARGLEQFAGGGMEPDVGLLLPSTGSQQVEWAEVAQQREPSPGDHVYTVAVQTRPGGLQYLTVPVERDANGSLSLSGYPAFVGPPSSSPPQLDDRLRPVGDQELVAVVRRALSNYLSGSTTDLSADLTSDAETSVPLDPLKALLVQTPRWAPGGGAVTAVVQAEDARGAHYTLSYEMNVVDQAGRWEISAIQALPDA